MKKRVLMLAALLMAALLPQTTLAVQGRGLTNVLRDLCTELHADGGRLDEAQQRLDTDRQRQHRMVLDVITRANELSILLYTQEQERTFNLAYALKRATDEYADFGRERRPYQRVVASLDYEIERYERLVQALRRLTPALEDSISAPQTTLEDSISAPQTTLEDSTSVPQTGNGNSSPLLPSLARPNGTLDTSRTGEVSGEGLDELARRDSCLVYAAAMLEMYARNRAAVMADSAQYQEACQRMEEAYAYALARYQALERYVFVEGQTPFMDIMANWGYYWDKCRADLHSQYSMGELLAAVDANEAEEHADEDDEDDDISFMKSLSSRAENALLVVVCIMQLFVLACFWVVTYVGMRLACRFTRLRRFISRDKLPIVSVLTGTVLYFLVFGLLLRGDEYINLSVRHVNTFLWLLIAITGSLLLRVKPEQFRPSIQLYSATFLVVLVIIACRIIFIPDRLMNMLFPPVLLLAVLRQLYFCIKVARRPSPAASVDSTLGWVSLAIYLVAFIFSFLGYIFAALLILVWWYFLLALWLTIVCIDDLLRRYKARWVDRRVEVMRQRITYVTGEDRESLLFGATWLYDLVSQVAVPTLVLLSLPLCARLSLGIFDFDDLYVKFYEQPFMQLTDKDGTATLCVSGRSIVYLIILFFVMRYVSRAVHAVWRYVRFTAFMRKHNRTSIRVNEINLSLGNSIISALIWMAYIVVVINVWKIPTGSMGLVAGGLSAGIGLALKDTINNFIYGIQLMGGRLRVGDWIECDGVRGRVTSINYQCVQAETMEGTEMSFLNSSLFGKNFNNLTRNNSYELTTVSVGVAYGTDIGHVRRVLVEAMQQLRTKDSYGREIVDPARGVYVVVGGMNDSAVEIAVKQRVLVAERIGYVDRAKEVIYDALNAAGITIAFPQCDVHLS